MKPIAVLALVVVAIGGLFLAMNLLGESPSSGSQEALTQETQDSTEAPAGPASSLTDVQEQERSIAEVEAPSAGESRTDEASEASGTFWNNSLFGQVMNTKQVPLANAEVTLTRAVAANRIFANEPVDRSRDVTVMADEEGKYRFVNVEPFESYMIEASVPGYSRGSVADIKVGEEGDFEAPPVLLTLGATLTGVVKDTGGNVVPGAQLVLASQFSRPGQELTPDMLTTTSDSTGHYTIQDIPAGNRTLSIEADGYGNMSFGGLVFRDTTPVERDVVLEIAEMISGRVIGKTGESIEGAEILAMSYTNASRACRDVAFSDAEGQFVLDSLSPGQYTIAIKAVGYRPGHESRVKTGASGLLIQLSPQATVTGRVLVNGEAPAKYRVRLRQTFPNNPATSAVGSWQSFQNPDGAFMLDSVQPNSYVVEAIAPGFAPSYSDEFRVGTGMPVKGVIVNLTRGGAIVGRAVSKDGAPLAKPSISTHDNTWANTIFDQALGDQFPTNATAKKGTGQANGRFKLAGLKGGTYQVRVSAPGYCEKIMQDVLVQDGQDLELGDVSLIKGGAVSGQVFDAAGQPIAGAKVSLRPDGRQPGLPRMYDGRTDAAGKYRITGVFPGAYILSAARGGRGGDFLADLAQEQDTTQRVTLSDEQTLKYDLKLSR